MLEKEAADTLKFYLKQGIQMKNREILKESMEKVMHQGMSETIGDKDLITQASEMLKQLVQTGAFPSPSCLLCRLTLVTSPPALFLFLPSIDPKQIQTQTQTGRATS